MSQKEAMGDIEVSVFMARIEYFQAESFAKNKIKGMRFLFIFGIVTYTTLHEVFDQ